MSFGGGTRYPWFGVDARTNTELKAHKRHVETEARMRTLHGYLPPAICEECTLPDCRWCTSTRTCPMDSEYKARRAKASERDRESYKRRHG